jgi:hypothetical protein
MSLSKSKCWYSNNCLQFLKRVVPQASQAEKQHNYNQRYDSQYKWVIYYKQNIRQSAEMTPSITTLNQVSLG